MKFIRHENTWTWGHSTIIITSNGCGTVTVQFSNTNPKDAFISSLSVYKGKRNKGYGQKLLNEAERYALSQGAETIALRCDKKSWVYNWYSRCGYSIIGYSVDDDYMEEALPVLSKKLK